MKIFTSFYLLLFVYHVSAQTEDGIYVPNPRAPNFYMEGGGQSLTYSFNFDTRFSEGRDGLGARVGIGYFNIGGESWLSIPAGLNYLLGKGNGYFELGAGVTYFNAESPYLFNDSVNEVVGTLLFGYRLQPVNGGFLFRAGITPFYGSFGFWPFFGGLSLGYTW